MSEWRDFELKELTTKIGSGATPRGGQEAYKTEGISLIRSQNILDFSFSYSGLAFIDDDQANALKNVIIEEDDILINITGDSVARVAKVPQEVLPARVNQHVAILRPNKEKLDSDYLLYYLLNPAFKKHLLRIASDGATRNALTKSDLEELVIIAPEDVSDQKEVAKLLSVYDKKITLLRQQNEDLEELAQTLFKRWFVEFEFPNEYGEPYKSSGGRMVESELGEIPEGWKVANVKDFITKYNTGADAIQKAPMVEEDTGVRCLRIGDLSNYRDFNQWGFTKITPEHYKQYQLLKNDIVITRTSLLGLSYIVLEDLKAVFNNGSIRIRPKEGYALYLYSWLNSSDFKNHIGKITNETSTRPNMKMDYLLIYNVLDIPDKTLHSFVDVYQTVITKQNENLKEIQTLTELRDTLLPKLMSGELRVTKQERNN